MVDRSTRETALSEARGTQTAPLPAAGSPQTYSGHALTVTTLMLAATRRHNPVAWPSLVRTATDRFSNLAVVSVIALLATGIVNGVILVGSFRALLVTEYGRLLLLKIALFAVMLGLAAVNKFRLTPRLGARPDRVEELDAVRRLARNCHIELALGLATFAIVGWLGTLHPAIHLSSP